MKEFILSSMDGESLKLPVNPNSFNDEQSHNNMRFETYALGEIKAVGRTKLREISLESFFPARYQSYCTYKNFPSPYECKAMIEKWKNENKPIRLLITETDINYAYTIDRFIAAERDGTGDIYFLLELSEYRFLNVPVSHNPAPVKDSTGLKERPVSQNKVSKKAATQVKQVKKQVAAKSPAPTPSNPKPKAKEIDLFKIKSAELKKELANYKGKPASTTMKQPPKIGQFNLSDLVAKNKGGGSR